LKSIDNMAGNAAAGNLLSARDKQKFKYEILSLSGALVCLAAGLLYARLFPGQEIVRALITLAGIFVIGVPVVITAARGLLARDMQSAMEILVSIAMIVSVLDGQFTLAILIPVILTFVHFLEEKSIMGGRDAIEGLKRMQAETAVLLRDGEETEVGARDLKCGDIIFVRPGMALPVDGEVVAGVSSIDQKSLTGESVPKTAAVGGPVFAGTVNLDGSIQVRVTKEYADTSFQKIVKTLEDAERIKLPATRLIDRFMFYYIPLTLAAALLVWLFTQDITRAIAVLVVSCPCGHLLISSAPMIAALSNAAKRGILIKNSAFVEQLAETDYVIFDKTGTITGGTLEAGSYHLMEAAGFDELVTAAAGVAHASLHPISKSIVALCGGMELETGYDVKEHIGKGIEGRKNGDTVYLGSTAWIRSLGYDVPDKYEDVGACDWVVKNGRVLGCLVFKDTPREDAAGIVAELKSMGMRTCLLTGDRLAAAERIQAEVGMEEMHCELLPEEKLAHVERAMEGNTVTVVGDGINDALALSKAHVGIAMGAMGSDTAIQSADIALMNNNLANVPYAIRLARKTKGIIYQNIVLAFSVSLLMIFLAGAGIVTPVAGAFLHNIGAFAILLNSGRLLKAAK